MVEKRKFARISLERSVRLKFKGKEQFVRRILKDVSLGGMFIETSNPLPVDTQFNFEFSISDDIPTIKGKGIVVRTTNDAKGSKNGMGIKFLHIEGDGREILKDLIKKFADSGENAGFTP